MDTLIHSLRDITIRRISVSEMDNNVYLLTAKESGAQLLIDAADDLPAIQSLLADATADTSGGAEAGARSPPRTSIGTTCGHCRAWWKPPGPRPPPERMTPRNCL